MAQSSAAREPTMEEILASIRRIIESNDEGAPPRVDHRPQLAAVAGNAQAVAEAVPETPPAETASLETATIAEVRPAAPAASDAGAPARAISLADVAARLRGRDEGPAAAPLAGEPPAVANDDEADEDVAETNADDVIAVTDAIFVLDDDRESTADRDADRDADAAKHEPAQQESFPRIAEAAPTRHEQLEPATSRFDLGEPLAMGEAAPMAAKTETAARPEPDTPSALVSMETGTKVAAAFDDLNSAIAEGRMRSFEELAQELLRPMLAEWLDDNLPTLVERLVREEIERVARGGRR